MMKIKVSHECPIVLLPESRKFNDYCYALVHLFETHPEYLQFYKDSVSMGREVLLDNSIFELKKAFEPKAFAKWVEELKPSYYIIPDVLENGYETVQSAVSFIREYKNLKGIKIGVVQGKTYDEISDCYKFMADTVDYIAISFDYSYYLATGVGKTKLERYCNGRCRLVDSLINDGTWDFTKPHHLLGASLAREFRYYVHNNIHNIRSIDTSNPVVAGIKGFRYTSDLGLNHKPSQMLAEMIDCEINDTQSQDIYYNVRCFKNIIGRYEEEMDSSF